MIFSKEVNCKKAFFTMPFGLSMFDNMEQVDYCVPLPLKEYSEIRSRERAKHSFVLKKNKKYTMEVTGLFRSDEKISLDEYFKNSYTEKDEEEGKIVLKKQIVPATSCFYAIGYWNNQIYSSRFMEIVWLRKEDVVKLNVTYPISDTAIWSNRLKYIVRTTSSCM